jgi:hypothetical protein
MWRVLANMGIEGGQHGFDVSIGNEIMATVGKLLIWVSALEPNKW